MPGNLHFWTAGGFSTSTLYTKEEPTLEAKVEAPKEEERSTLQAKIEAPKEEEVTGPPRPSSPPLQTEAEAADHDAWGDDWPGDKAPPLSSPVASSSAGQAPPPPPAGSPTLPPMDAWTPTSPWWGPKLPPAVLSEPLIGFLLQRLETPLEDALLHACRLTRAQALSLMASDGAIP